MSDSDSDAVAAVASTIAHLDALDAEEARCQPPEVVSSHQENLDDGAIDVADVGTGGTAAEHSQTPAAAASASAAAADLNAVSRHLAVIKRDLYGTPDEPPDPVAASAVAKAVLTSGLLVRLLVRLPGLEFEGRKDATQVVANLLRKHAENEPSSVRYLCERPAVLLHLVSGYMQQSVALHHGTILREAIRHEQLARLLLADATVFPTLCQCIESAHFDVASDAYATTRMLLTKHRALVASFLDANYVAFFAQYIRLVRSQNYVTKRQSLRLLGELLLDRSNFAVMTQFIADPEHLKVVMILLREPSAAIQYEAFHVFKIFVANPRKPPAVLALLHRNKDRLLPFLEPFLASREQTDPTFRDEKSFLMDEIRKL